MMTAKTPSTLSPRPDSRTEPQKRSTAFLEPQAAIVAAAEQQLPLFDAAPDYSRGAWLAFDASDNPDDAKQAFAQRFGQLPQHAGIDARWRYPSLKVGPVPGLEGGA